MIEIEKQFKRDTGYELFGILNFPETYDTPIVVMCHGRGSDKNSPKYIALQKTLEEKGIASFRFTFYHRIPNINDLNFITDSLLELGYSRNKIGVVGSSNGGEIATFYASNNDVGALVLRAPTLAYISPHSFKSVKAPTLLIQGSRDEIVPRSIVDEYFKFLGGVKERIIIEGGNHELSNPEHQTQFVRYAADWFTKWLIEEAVQFS